MVGNNMSGRKRSQGGRYSNVLGGSTTSQASNNTRPVMDGHIDLRGDRLQRNTVMMAGQIKPLHDSCYIGPDSNPRVIQDHDAAKSTAWKQALQRHEAQIALTKNFNETVVTKHYLKIKDDESTNHAEHETIRQKK